MGYSECCEPNFLPSLIKRLKETKEKLMLEFNATFFVAMASFVIFMIIMNAILYKPLERIVKERQDIIDKNNLKSKIADEKCDVLEKWQKSSIEKAQKTSKETYQKILSEYKDQKESILDYNRALSRKEVAIASTELDGQVIGVKRDLESEAEILANIIVDKVLR